MEEYIPILIGIYQSLPTAGKMQFIACAGNLRDEYKNYPGRVVKLSSSPQTK